MYRRRCSGKPRTSSPSTCRQSNAFAPDDVSAVRTYVEALSARLRKADDQASVLDEAPQTPEPRAPRETPRQGEGVER